MARLGSQRYLFKTQPANKEKLHTGGLFAYARFINHTGHVLYDVANALLSRSVLHVFPPLIPADIQLCTEITQVRPVPPC